MLKKTELSNKEVLNYYQFVIENQQDQPTLVFIHGNFSHYQWWLDIVNHPRLAKFPKIIVDLRGFGQSTYNKKCTGFVDWASDVVELLKIKKLNRVIVIGWSFGCAITLKIAQLYPQVVQKIVLTASVGHHGFPLVKSNDQSLDIEEKLLNNPKIRATLKLLQEKNQEAMSVVFSTILYQKMLKYPANKKKILQKSPFMQRCYTELLIAMCKPDIDISKIKAKSLMIHGADDIVVPLDLARQTGEALGVFELWDNHAHMIPLEDTDRYVERCVKFFEE